MQHLSMLAESVPVEWMRPQAGLLPTPDPSPQGGGEQ